jgi:predicted enzyme related to lactoylglutathione lyase
MAQTICLRGVRSLGLRCGQLGIAGHVAIEEVAPLWKATLAEEDFSVTAVFAAFTPASPMTAQGDPKAGDFSWHELATTDLAAAFGFYRELFGWEKVGSHDMGPLGEYLLFGRRREVSWRHLQEAPGHARPSSLALYVRVANLKAILEKVRSEGGSVLNGPMEVPGGDLVAQCLDPQARRSRFMRS